ncbi:MAG: CDC27 family protein [Spirochaetes bacterium]|jgi:tetratricopeptide (TPR) repeat protein|nr:CDC27 family protein [Spirochaetota bacterium]
MPCRITARYKAASYRRLFAVATLLLAAPGVLFAASDGFVDRQASFVRGLYREGRYFECIAETRRLMRYVPSPRRHELEYFISANYYQARQYRTVIRRLTALPPASPDPASRLLLSQSLARLGDYAEAVRTIESADTSWPEGTMEQERFIRAAQLSTLAGNFALAYDEAERGAAKYPASILPTLRDGLSEHGTLPSRSRPLAAALSAVVPGAGQTYAGRYTDAIWSVTAVLALGAGTAWAWRQGHRGAAFTFGFFATLVYAGGVYGAWNAADSYNRSRTDRFRSEVLRMVPEYEPLRGEYFPAIFR